MPSFHHSRHHSLLLLLATLLCSKSAIGAEVKVKNADDFINFTENVNSGTSYSGTTVFLDSDIDLSGNTLGPIGFFLGVFDGQGHVIRNLIMTSSSQYVGLFGYSGRITIKNVILDSSCSITSSYSGSDKVYVGGIIGNCDANNGPCTIENNVNMGNASFSGDISGSYLYLGGIAGRIDSSSNHESTVKNCVNYGDVTHSGKSRDSYIGGIVGDSCGYSSAKIMRIYNSLNHGEIAHNGTSHYLLYLGGIAGKTQHTTIENCVNGRKISSNKSSSVGSIVGWVSSDTSINYCYYASNLSSYGKYGTGTPSSESNTLSYDSTTFVLNGTVSIESYSGNLLIEVLNAASGYYKDRDYSNWTLNKNKKTLSFTINGNSPFTLNYQVILLPSLASEGKLWFDGWYVDSELTTSFKSDEITESTKLYGRFEENTNNYTITFDTRKEGVTVAPITAQFGSVVTLPSESIRKDCTVVWWENKYGDYVGLDLAMPSHNITLYAVWKCTRIKTVEDFVDFSNAVNNVVDYSGTTVFLDSDIDFTGKTFEPIGYYTQGLSSNYFRGTFDGQGHVVSNLTLTTSSSRYAGLFGYSEGLTIRNTILDSSCSFQNSYSDYLGGIIGYCKAEKGPCTIENSVNMASVTLNSTGYLYLGGIAGRIDSSSNYESTVKNCVNYGDVTNIGTSSYSNIGGIVGRSYGFSSKKVYIYNCLNFGTITRSGTTRSYLYLGGITGYTYHVIIENCVSGGRISSTKTSYIGSIVGYVYSDTPITHCPWSSDVGYNVASGTDNPNITNSSLITSFKDTINEMNEYANKDITWNKWLLNANNASVTFRINSCSGFTVTSLIILFPDLSGDERKFSEWFADEKLTNPFNPNEVISDITIYGGWIVGVTFDVNGGEELSVEEMRVELNGTYGVLPKATKAGHSFSGWFSEKDGGVRIESGDRITDFTNHTLYAQWTPNNYIITFDFSNGTIISAVLLFNATITYPENPTKEGHTFAGWSPKLERMPAGNITVTAQWTEKPSEFVEIVFSKKDLSKKEAKEIIEKFVPEGEEFTIENIDGDEETGGTRIIVKFADKETAQSFVETVKASSDAKNVIRVIEFIYDSVHSLSMPLFRLQSQLFTLILSFLCL